MIHLSIFPSLTPAYSESYNIFTAKYFCICRELCVRKMCLLSMIQFTFFFLFLTTVDPLHHSLSSSYSPSSLFFLLDSPIHLHNPLSSFHFPSNNPLPFIFLLTYPSHELESFLGGYGVRF